MSKLRHYPPVFLEKVRRFTQGDDVILILLVLFTLLSCAMLYSASGQDLALVMRQLARFGVGFLLMFLLMQVTVNVYHWWTPAFYGLCVLLLWLVLFYGETAKGAQRWLDIGFTRFQPSELLKIAVPLMVCYIFSEEIRFARIWKFLLALLIIILPAILVMMQPDFGTALLVSFIGLSVLFLAGLHWGWIVGMVVLLATVSPIVWNNLLDYQRQRLLVFSNPENDALGAGYHIIQSKIAIGSGGLWGKGWLNGTQSHLGFLPERSTDFIFSTFAEEFGFIGVLVLFFMYSLLIVRGIKIAMIAVTDFERLLASGLTLALFVYFSVNVGMVSGMIPVVGAPLPLMSYGGTSTVTVFAAFGVIMAIYKNRPLIGA